jgi:hypothetical protein
VVALLLPPTATGGGWWTSIRVDRATVSVGQRVNVHANVMFSPVDATAAEREFYVYLLRDFDYSVVERAMHRASPGRWWSADAEDAIRVGRVVIGGSSSNLALANASFRVPKLPPDTYALMLCDAGCVRPLADVIPMAEFVVVANPVVARLAVRVDRLERQTFEQAQKRLAEHLAAEEAELAAASKLTQAQGRIETLEQQLQESRRSTWSSLPWLIAGLTVGIVVGFGLRRRRSEPPANAGWQLSDGELEELLSSERRRARV